MTQVPLYLLPFLGDRAVALDSQGKVRNETPWTIRVMKIKGDDRGHRYITIIPRARLKDFVGGPLPARAALERGEGLWGWTVGGRFWHGLIGLRNLINSPAPATWDDAWGSDRRKYCAAHCSRCGLHFSSTSAFNQHVRERHRHPSKSKMLVPVKGRDTGCSLCPSSIGLPVVRFMRQQKNGSGYLPGIRIWEHVNAQSIREVHVAREG